MEFCPHGQERDGCRFCDVEAQTLAAALRLIEEYPNVRRIIDRHTAPPWYVRWWRRLRRAA